MTVMHSRTGYYKVVATLGLVLFMTVLSACEILATEGARSAIANGREIREFEDRELGPIENEMNDLWVNEINPRENALEDLRYEMQTLEEDVLRPLWDAQNDVWAPGGAASEARVAIEKQYREMELARRAIEIDQRDLDARWQSVWTGTGVDPEFQALESLRYDKQRELDRVYRFGNRPIDEIWDKIAELNAQQGFANTDSQIESDSINNELRRLWDQLVELQYSDSDESIQLNEKAVAAQDQLNALYNHGSDTINQIYAEIEQLEAEQTSTTSPTTGVSIAEQIAELEISIATFVAARDAEVAALGEDLAAIEADSITVDSTDSTDSSVRIAELRSLIEDLEAQAAALVAEKDAEKDVLSSQINDIKHSYDLLIASAEAEFHELSTSLVAAADALKAQIDELEEIGGDDAAAEIAVLQPQFDALIAKEEAEEDALGVLVDQYKADEDAELVEPKALKDAVEALLLGGLTDDLDTQIAVYEAELEALGTDSTETTVTEITETETGTQTAADILVLIESSESYWNGLIDEATNKILILETELLIESSDDDTDSRIQNLKLQAAELEKSLNDEIASLKATIDELYRQANNASSADSAGQVEIQSQIDALNARVEAIWQHDSASSLAVRQQIQELERQTRVLQEENEEVTYLLEEELWDLDDRIGRFYQDQNSGTQEKEATFQAESAAIQQRQRDLQEVQWALEEEQRAVDEAINLQQIEASEAIKVIENETFGAIRDQMRVLELELRDLYGQQRVLERALNEAQALVEEKKRELEDKVFDALEEAAGIAGETAEAGPSTFDDEAPEATEAPEVTEATEATEAPEAPEATDSTDNFEATVEATAEVAN